MMRMNKTKGERYYGMYGGDSLYHLSLNPDQSSFSNVWLDDGLGVIANVITVG